MKLYDSHIHSIHSHDGKFTVCEMAEASIKRGLAGICITDHFDCGMYGEDFDFKHISDSFAATKAAADIYKDKIEIIAGIELGDYPFDKALAHKCLNMFGFDFILCSIHSTLIGKTLFENFENNNSYKNMTSRDDDIFLEHYFRYTLDTVSDTALDFDSLAHLTYPIRYITAVNSRPLDITRYYEIFCEIFKVLISREKALEINTSCLATDWKYTLPDYDIIKMYYNLGGRLITLGSDSHFTERLGLGFEQVLRKLNEIGFENYYVYKKRKPIAIGVR